ncbi:NAD-dependent succinate-semialdehyde dehydrogenase [Streptomyces sp. NPDC046909]|uniref:NAD-dependent succinate-semialdehyde dehydrogenase n=1 Tax=Streptomyces sp. NPDC046909 TaxID=3155617 RepID=UPI0033F0F73F
MDTARQEVVIYRSVDPVTGEEFARFDLAQDAAIDESLARADDAYRQWCSTPIVERAAVSHRVADILASRVGELADLATREMGKPRHEAVEELDLCVSIFRYYGDHGPKLAADEHIEAHPGDRAVIQRRPIGVVLGIMPWNFPYYQVARFVAPNLVLGNTILLKHAESVPQCAAAIEQVLTDAGLPDGTYQNLYATHGQVERLIADDRVRGVSLTGSERAGSAVAAIAGRYLKKCVLELGGSDPYIVLDTDDVRGAARLAWQTRMYNTGQTCNSNKRMIVHEEYFRDFVDELTRLARVMRPADPTRDAEPGTYCPLSSRSAAEHLDAQIQDAVTKGAQVHAGGRLGPAPGAYFAPTVLTAVSKGMRAYHEELFGPVAVVYSVQSDVEAVELANDSVYGLGGAVFSVHQSRALDVAGQLEVGMSNVNTPAGEGAAIPFGGVKRSGYGRELGPLGMDEFANKRLLYVAGQPSSVGND